MASPRRQHASGCGQRGGLGGAPTNVIRHLAGFVDELSMMALLLSCKRINRAMRVAGQSRELMDDKLLKSRLRPLAGPPVDLKSFFTLVGGHYRCMVLSMPSTASAFLESLRRDAHVGAEPAGSSGPAETGAAAAASAATTALEDASSTSAAAACGKAPPEALPAPPPGLEALAKLPEDAVSLPRARSWDLQDEWWAERSRVIARRRHRGVPMEGEAGRAAPLGGSPPHRLPQELYLGKLGAQAQDWRALHETKGLRRLSVNGWQALAALKDRPPAWAPELTDLCCGDGAALALLPLCPRLERLRVRSSPAPALAAALRSSPSVRVLSMETTQICAMTSAEHLGCWSSLTSLSLCSCDLAPRLYRHRPEHEALAAVLAAAPALRRLGLEIPQPRLCGLRDVRACLVEWCAAASRSGPGGSRIGQLDLVLEEPPLASVIDAMRFYLPGMRTLRLATASGLSAEAAGQLSSLTSLRELELASMKRGDPGLPAMGGVFAGLDELRMSSRRPDLPVACDRFDGAAPTRFWDDQVRLEDWGRISARRGRQRPPRWVVDGKRGSESDATTVLWSRDHDPRVARARPGEGLGPCSLRVASAEAAAAAAADAAVVEAGVTGATADPAVSERSSCSKELAWRWPDPGPSPAGERGPGPARVACPRRCGATTDPEDADDHDGLCGLAVVPCPLSAAAGCRWKGPRWELWDRHIRHCPGYDACLAQRVAGSSSGAAPSEPRTAAAAASSSTPPSGEPPPLVSLDRGGCPPASRPCGVSRALLLERQLSRGEQQQLGRRQSCPWGCGARVRGWHLDEHRLVCASAPSPCPLAYSGCSAVVARRDVAGHLGRCPKYELASSWTALAGKERGMDRAGRMALLLSLTRDDCFGERALSLARVRAIRRHAGRGSAVAGEAAPGRLGEGAAHPPGR